MDNEADKVQDTNPTELEDSNYEGIKMQQSMTQISQSQFMNNAYKEREFDLSSSGNIFKTNLEHAATNGEAPYVGPF